MSAETLESAIEQTPLIERADGEVEPQDSAERFVAIDGVRAYMHEIGKTPLLTKEQSYELAQRIEAGVFARESLDDSEKRALLAGDASQEELEQIAAQGSLAFELLTRANLRLVVSVAKRYTASGLPLLDLIQEGNVGLIRAVEMFDYKKGYTFATYAQWWIRQAVSRSIADTSRTIRLPVNKHDTIFKLGQVERKLTVDLGREPTEDEVADMMGIDRATLQNLHEISRKTMSLNQRIGDESAAEFGDFLPDDAVDIAATVENIESQQLFSEILATSTLDEREHRVLQMHYGLDGAPLTLHRIAQELGLSHQRVSTIQQRAQRKLAADPRLKDDKWRDLL